MRRYSISLKLHGPPILVSPINCPSLYGFEVAFGTLYVFGCLPLNSIGIEMSFPLKNQFQKNI